MTESQPSLLLTRPEPQSRRFAEAFRARFGGAIPVVISPVIAIRPLAVEIATEGADGVIFTSENAVAAFCAATPRRDLTAWCVGERTAAAARAEGFVTHAGPGEATGLAAMMRREGARGRLLYPHGVHRAADLGAMLEPDGIETVSIPVYDQEERELDAGARALLAGAGRVLLPLFSPRSARLVARQARGARARLAIAAISAAAAEAARDLPAERVETARRPDAEAMLDALARLIDTGRVA